MQHSAKEYKLSQLKGMEFLLQDTFLSYIRGSVGSRNYLHSYWLISNQKKNLTKGGQYSCAFFVSATLKIFDLISTLHLTVDGTIKDLLANQWERTNNLTPGSILVWHNRNRSNDEHHGHVGFYLGDDVIVCSNWYDKAIGTRSYKKEKAKIKEIYAHPKLIVQNT